MYRLIRTTRRAELLDAEAAGQVDAEEAERLAEDLEMTRVRAERAEASGERLLRDLALVHADAFAADVRAHKAMAEAAEVEEVRRDVRELRRAVADPETGTEVQGRIAVTVLRELLEKAEREAAETGAVLDPWYQLIGMVLAPARSEGGVR
ncbi:MAG: hypothetical protein ACTH0H_05705 [Brachybacterium sp.]